MKNQAVLQCIMGQGDSKWYKQCALHVKWWMGGKTHLMELNCVLIAVYESPEAPGTATWLFTAFVYGMASMASMTHSLGGWAAGPQGSKDD